jgi:hypothetical protein
MTSLKLTAAAALLALTTAGLTPALAQMSGESPNPTEQVGESNVTEQLMRLQVRMETMSEENAQLKRLVADLLAENQKLKGN